MSSDSTAGFVALLLPLLLSAGPWACSADNGPPKRYPSPKAVFDAYREARARRDWRTCFSLMTRELQDDVIFECDFACEVRDDKDTNAILKRFGIDEATLMSDLRREYKAKHGVEPADEKAFQDALEKEYKAAHGVPPPSPRYVWTDILRRHVKDRAGFYEAAVNLIVDHPPSPIGDLEQAVIHDDTATGRATVPAIHPERPPGEAPRKVEDTRYKTFRFRKVNGGWLLNSV
ncbi:MAG: hypothetical protein P4L84_13675 [Isosphaeraceae bacterium]|nr:hypothetical protein [Isosphaeraceae bacterium]